MAATRIFLVIGTDTGVGKTLLATLLTRHLRTAGVDVRAVKPLCTGGREDARLLRAAQDPGVSVDEVNPWHFRWPLTPLLAARRERVRVNLAEVLDFLRQTRSRCDVLIVEAAGGLLSPLGEGFSARELAEALESTPIVVSPNRLGTINQVRLALAALPSRARQVGRVVLMSPRRPDLSSRTNPAMLAELLGPERVDVVPWLDANQRSGSSPPNARLRRVLEGLLR